MRTAFPFALALLFAAAGCHKAPPPANTLDALDNDLVNGAVADESPANKALAGAIQVDPAKTGRHGTGDRAASVSLAQIAERQAHGQPAMPAVTEDGEGSMVDGGSGCLGGLVYSNSWATKLPADLPMHPAARLQEAAGHDGSCQARAVSFTVPGDRGQLLGWYRAKAQAAGYSTARADDSGDWILTGAKGASAYHIMLGAPDHGETPVDYVWTNGG
jgi:hypothetical protein